MSLDPRLGHLYNDSTASIEAKEQLRIRQINAREKRHLAQNTYVLDRARNICERSRKWEHENVKRQMKKIRDRTLSLEMSLKQEAKRVAIFKKGGKEVTSAPSLVSRTSVFADVPREVKSAPDMSSLGGSSKSNEFKRRSRHVVRALMKMYIRCDERKRRADEQAFKLDQAQIDALQKARLVLKGTETEGEIARILAKNSEGRQVLRVDRGSRARQTVGSDRVFGDCQLPGNLQTQDQPRPSDSMSGYTSLLHADTITAINQGNGAGGSPVEDEDIRISSNTAAGPVSWTRFNKLPELWRQECTTQTPFSVTKTKLTNTTKYRKSRVK